MSDYIDDDNLWKEDLFATLGIDPNASDSEIKKAYLKLAKKYHPDKFLQENDEKHEAHKIFSKITVAYDVLSDARKKNNYLELRTLLADRLPENQKVIAVSDNQTNSQAKAGHAQTIVTPIINNSVSNSVNNSVDTSKPPEIKAPPESSNSTAEILKTEQAGIFYNKGLNYMKSKNYDKAIESFKQAISIKKDIAEYHSQLGLAYQNKNWTGMAQGEFRVAQKLNPKDVIAKKNIVPEDPKAKKKKQKEKKKAMEKQKKQNETHESFFSKLFQFGKKK